MLRSSVSSDVSSEICGGGGLQRVEGDATSYQLNCLPHSAGTLGDGWGRGGLLGPASRGGEPV